MTDTWKRITDWDIIRLGEELQVQYLRNGKILQTRIKKVYIITDETIFYTKDTGGFDNRSEFDNGTMILSRRAKQQVVFKKGYESFKGIDITGKNIKDKYPHQCPKCGANSYNCPISGRIDCSKCN
jgi:sRNA-binding regulator protein Hfq